MIASSESPLYQPSIQISTILMVSSPPSTNCLQVMVERSRTVHGTAPIDLHVVSVHGLRIRVSDSGCRGVPAAIRLWRRRGGYTISEYWKNIPELPDVSSCLVEGRQPPATLHGVVFDILAARACGGEFLHRHPQLCRQGTVRYLW